MDLSFLPTVPPGARRALRVRRREISGALLVVAAILAALAMVPPDPAPVPVVVAARDVPAGRTLAASDVRIAEVARERVAPTTLTGTAEAVGQVSATTLPEGRPLVSTDLAGSPAVLDLAPPGSTVLAVPVPDPRIASAVTPGRDLLLFLSFPALTGAPAAPAGTTRQVAAVVLVPPDPAATEDAPASALVAVPAGDAAPTAVAVRLDSFTLGLPSGRQAANRSGSRAPRPVS